MANENQNPQGLPDKKNKEMAKSKDPSLKTVEEGDPDQASPGSVGGSSTGGSSDGTGNAS